MNVSLSTYITRLVLLILIQVIVLHNALIGLSLSRYMLLFIYPLFVMLLPVRMRPVIILVICFVLGFFVDLFYHTPGINASALLFVGFARMYVLQFLEPREKYDQLSIPSLKRYGFQWFVTYVFILTFIYCLSFTLLESFTVSSLHIVVLRAVLSTIASTILILLYQNIAVRY